jgi:hypothetical protein
LQRDLVGSIGARGADRSQHSAKNFRLFADGNESPQSLRSPSSLGPADRRRGLSPISGLETDFDRAESYTLASTAGRSRAPRRRAL